MKIGDRCATWNCKGKVRGNSKREDGTWIDVKCAVCGREYWHDDMFKSESKEIKCK